MSLGSNGLCFANESTYLCLGWEFTTYAALLALAVLAVALVPLLLSSRRTPTASEAAARANRHATLGSVSAAVVLLAVMAVPVGNVLLGPLLPGRTVAVLPAAGGLAAVLVQALAQVTWPRPSGERREADLSRRTRRDVVPRGLHVLLLGWTGGVLVALVGFMVNAAGPRSILGRPPHSPDWAEVGPYPGSYYAVPVAVATLALVVVTELVLRLVVLRPAVPGVTRGWDLHLRRRSARHVVGAAQVAAAAMLAGMLAIGGVGHLRVGPHALGVLLEATALAVTLVALGALLPRPRRRRAGAAAPSGGAPAAVTP